MDDEKYDQLAQEAQECFYSRNYERELEIWLEIETSDSANPALSHNIALALMNLNRFDEALAIFDYLVEVHPYLSRAHNNRAILLMKMGIEWAELLPDFMNALIFSEDLEGFWRHFVNICNTLSYGFEDFSEDIFKEFEQDVYKIINDLFEGGLDEKTEKTVKEIIECFRDIREFRQAFVLRKWNIAEQFLNKAKENFNKIGLPNFARGLDRNMRTNFILCKEIFLLLEKISSSVDLKVSELINEISNIILRTNKIIKKRDGASADYQLLVAVHCFQNGLLQSLNFLSTPNIEFVSNKSFSDKIKFQTSNSFVDLGKDLVTMLEFIDKQCMYLNETLNISASQLGQINLLRNTVLTKVSLFFNGLLLNYKEIDISLARSMLGWDIDLLGDVRNEIVEFKSIIERQLYRDVYVNDNPQENIARGMLQAFLSKRSYREVKVKGGQTDILVFTKKGKIIYETKIWRGPQYHEQGYREIEEYIKGEDDGNLLGVFYIVFDATVNGKASKYIEGEFTIKKIFNNNVYVVVINLFQPIPSKK